MGSMDIHALRMVFGSKRTGLPSMVAHDSQVTTDSDVEVINTLCAFFKPKVFVEIGVFEGQTSKMVLDASPWIEKYIGVDMLPEHLPKEYFSQMQGLKNTVTGEEIKPVKQPGFKAMGDPRFDMILLGSTGGLRPEMIGLADMIFIDGDHEYEAVKRDTEITRSVFHRRKGVLLWHDYTCCQYVKKYINECNAGNDAICLVVGTNMCFQIIQ